MLVVGRISREIKLKSRIKRRSNKNQSTRVARALFSYLLMRRNSPIWNMPPSSEPTPLVDTPRIVKHPRRHRTLTEGNQIFLLNRSCAYTSFGSTKHFFVDYFFSSHSPSALFRRGGRLYFFFRFERGGPTSVIKERFRSQNKTTTQ